MISICSLSCNAKNELATFVESLVHYNPDVDFEICIAHDNRVDDGSSEKIRELQERFSQLKVVENTKQDATDYITTLVSYYDSLEIFPEDFRANLWLNIHKYLGDNLCDPSESYLWLALGYMFNKAASIATGDILIFLPSDYIWTVNLRDLEAYVIEHRQNGMFYGKFSGLYLPISNEEPEVLKELIKKPVPTAQITRSYIHYPSTIFDHYLLNFKDNQLLQLGTQEYRNQFVDICRKTKGTESFADMHHGTHIMTRKVWEITGGFTEEFYGRAWPDDKMNAHAMRAFWTNASTMPIEFSFSFIQMAQWKTSLSGVHPRSQNFSEPYTHPIQGHNYHQIYLDHGYHDKQYTTNINAVLDKEFRKGSFRGREAPVIRLVK